MTWALFSNWKTIYSANEVTVKYREAGQYLLIGVLTRSSVSPSFRFDYWQDGLQHKIDMLKPGASKVEPIYSVLENGDLCDQFGIFDIDETRHASTVCGGMQSTAIVTGLPNAGTHRAYILILPKSELSANLASANMVIDFWNETTQDSSSYPAQRFKQPVHIVYGQKLFGFSWPAN